MKKLICLALVCTLALAGCAPRGGGEQNEELGDNSVAPLELSEEEAALLALVGGADTEYGVYQLSAGEAVTGCSIEVLSWQDGQWLAVGGGSVGVSGSSDSLRLGVVLEEDGIRINWQDGSGRYSVGERAPLYLAVYDDGEGVTSAALPDSFFDVAYLNQYDRAYAVAITLEA